MVLQAPRERKPTNPNYTLAAKDPKQRDFRDIRFRIYKLEFAMHFCGPVIWELIIFGTRDEVNRLTAYSLEDFNLEPSISDPGYTRPSLRNDIEEPST